MNLISQMLVVNPIERIDAVTAMNHDFFKNKSRAFQKMKLKAKTI